MKKLLIAMVLTPMMALAETEVVDGIEWSYSIVGETAQIGGDGRQAISRETTGAITIPSTLGGYPVTGIGDYAFGGCSGLTSVTIPDGVTSIGDEAFGWCHGLRSVEMPVSVEYIGEMAFVNCLYLASVTIPSRVTSIGDYAFSACYGLVVVTIPSSVTSIGEGAFDECSSIQLVFVSGEPQSCVKQCFGDEVRYQEIGTPIVHEFKISYENGEASVNGVWPAFGDVVVPSISEGIPVTSIGAEAFFDCDGLTSVTIPSSVTSIGRGAFISCSGLTSMTIPSSVMSIGDQAFYYCQRLTSVTIPSSVKSIGWGAFSDCSKMTEIVVEAGNAEYASHDGVLYDKAMTGLIQCPAGKIGSVTIPSSVTSIGEGALRGCNKMMEILVDPGNTFYSSHDGILYDKAQTELIQCPAGKVGSVTIPGGVLRIGDGAFYVCQGLTSVTIPSSVKSIGPDAFYGTNIVYDHPDDLVIVDGCLIGYKGMDSETIVIPNGVRLIAGGVFESYYSIKSVTIPSSVKSIGDCAFGWCSGLTSVTIPSSVTSIGDSVFCYCSGLMSVTISRGVTSIGDWTFEGCSGLTSVTIPSSVKNIGNGAFYNCSGLTSVTISSGVTSIGDWAFRGCSGLTSVTIPSSVKSIGWSAFYGCNELKTVYVSTRNDIVRVMEMLADSGFKISGLTFKPQRSPAEIAGIAVGSAAVVGVAGHFFGRAVSEAIGKKKGNPTYKQFKAMKLVVPELDARGITYKNKLVYHPAKGTVTGRVVLTVQKGDRTQKIRAKAKGMLKDGVITGTLDAKGFGPLDFTVK